MIKRKYKGVVFFDIDGTLIEIGGKNHQVRQSVKDAVKQLKERNFLVGIATGRADAYIPKLNLGEEALVSFNGGVARLNGEIVFKRLISQEKTRAALEFFASRGLDYLAETIEGCFYYGEAKKNFYWIGEIVQPIEEYSGNIKNMQAVKITSPYNDEILKEFGVKFGDVLDFVPHRYDCFMDIGLCGISKATGIQAIVDVCGIEKENSYAFGDDANDYEMLSVVGHGIAMTPHAKALDEVSEYITGTISEEGIYNALKHYGLI